jgi:hypothetical protein
VGPEIHGNTVVDNSINGLFIRVRTPAGQDLQPMTVSGRWNDTDIVHVLSENLRVQGDPGGALQTLVAPNVSVVGVRQEGSGTLAAGAYTYRMTYVDADGQESPASDPTDQVLVNGFQGVRLSNLPLAPAGYTARRIYRSEKDSFVLVAELTGTTRTYLDDGTTAGGLLQGSNRELQARLHGRLAIDAGAIVKLNGAGLETGFGAQLIAEGNAGREVIFTSLQDDRFGTGGTFSTSTRGDLQPGAWSGLYLSPASSASIDHAVIAYGGGVTEIPGTFTGFNAIEVHQADARIVNTLFELNADGTGGQGTANRAGRGSNAPGVVFVRGAQPVVVNNVLQDNRGPVVSIDVNALNFEPVQDLGRSTGTVERFGSLVNNRGPMIRENRLDNNELNGMQVRGGTLTTEGVWDDTDIVHLVLDDTIYVPDFHTYGGLRLQSSGDASLVVKLEGPDAGFTAVGQPLDITDRVGGTLQIVGTTGHPVVLTAVADDTVGAGFTPDGRPQNNTRDDGTNGDAGSLPTGPEVDNGTLIDNDVPVNIPGHFEIQPGDGGSVFFGSSGATAQGLTQLFVNQNWIFDFDNYVDVLSDGGAISLSTTNITMPATLVSPDLVVSEGNFTGPGGQVDWRVETFLNDGEAIVYNRLTLSSAAPLGDIRYISYLDEDVQGISDDLLWTVGTPGQADFRAFTLDGPERIGFSHGGIYEPGPDLVNATYTGWAADQYFDLQSDILGPGTNYTIPGNIDLVDLPPGVDASLGDINGPEDVTTAFAWNVDPTATTATMVSLLELVPRDPTLAGGQWRSVQLLSGANDRNVGTVTEEETGSRVDTGTNDQPNVAQHVVDLAPNEKSGDDNLRLGVEIHGSLNHPQDLDVYSFEAVGGTEVWLDIDSTSSSLDTVLELIDEDGTVLARSDNSTAEARDPSLLYQNPNVMAPGTVNPLARTHDAPKDEYTINPRDAGMRVILPGTAGATDTYRVRVRSGSPDLSNLEGGLTTGVYDLQIRLREQDEVAGSTVDTADIRFATNGIELVGLPAHSPLTGEAAEKRDANGNDTNNSLAAPDDLGNLMNTDRGTLSVAGVLDGTTDVDWYQFDIRYDALPFYQDDDTKHLATVFDIDYADGFSRANTNLWVFDDQGRLIYTGSDSNVADDRPVQDSEFSADLARGSLGELDPYIGTVELPAESLVSTGRYYVAVTSNATLPEEMLQYLTATPTNPLVRAEPVNSVKRIAEDRINSLGLYTTADAPTVPVLFGDEDEVQLFVPDGSQVKDGERIRIDNRAGFWETYEFDADGIVADGNIPISYDVGWTADEMAAAVAQTISFNPPQSFSGSFNPTADQPVIQSDLFVFSTLGGVVILQESVFEEVLLNEVTTTGFFGTPSVQQITRFNSYQTAPKVRQMLAFSESELSVQVSRPAALPYTLGDLTLFVTEEGARDRTELVSVDPFTGQMETRIGAFSANVGDVAMHPRGGSPGVGNEGGLFAYSIPETNPFDDTTTGHYWQVNPGLPTPNELGVDLGDDGVDTYIEDPANPGNSIRARQGGAQNGVGMSYNAITFNNQEQDSQVRGYAIGTRGDVFVDPFTGELTSFANGIPNPANILFEFNPNTGAVTNPPGVQDRTAAGILQGGRHAEGRAWCLGHFRGRVSGGRWKHDRDRRPRDGASQLLRRRQFDVEHRGWGLFRDRSERGRVRRHCV